MNLNSIQDNPDSSQFPQLPLLQQPRNPDLNGRSPPPDQEVVPTSYNQDDLSRGSSQSSEYGESSDRHSVLSQSSQPSSTMWPHSPPEEIFHATLPPQLKRPQYSRGRQEEDKQQASVALNKQLRSPDNASRSKIQILKDTYYSSGHQTARNMPRTLANAQGSRHGGSLRTLTGLRKNQLQEYITTNYVALSREKSRPKPLGHQETTPQVSQRVFRRSVAERAGLKRRTSAPRKGSAAENDASSDRGRHHESPPPRSRWVELQIEKKKQSAYQIKVIDWNPVQKSIQRRQFRRTWKVQYDSVSSTSLGDKRPHNERK